MSLSLPKRRSDLDRQKHRAADGITYVIKEPESGQFFRLHEAEGFILDQLDGKTSRNELLDRIEKKFDTRLAPEVLDGFVENLDSNGLLETKRSARVRRRARKRAEFGKMQGGALTTRVKLVNPKSLLDRLIRPLRLFFTPEFVVLASATILLAIGILVFNWDAIVDGVMQLVRWSMLPLLILTIFFALSLHELAHGLTCRHFGGEVREMGFMFLYFQPALYCNVSDAWLFPEKSKRLWVTFSGPFFEVFLWALAVILWRVTDPDTWINQASLVLMTTSGAKTLLNFCPLIKLDGYYLLSDYLEIPNLRQRSFTYLGETLKHAAGLKESVPSVSERERRIYLRYGVVAFTFSMLLIISIGTSVGEFLIMEQQRVAFFALAGLIGFRLRSRFNNLFAGKTTGFAHSGRDQPEESESIDDLSSKEVSNQSHYGRENQMSTSSELEVLYRGPSSDKTANESPAYESRKGDQPTPRPARSGASRPDSTAAEVPKAAASEIESADAGPSGQTVSSQEPSDHRDSRKRRSSDSRSRSSGGGSGSSRGSSSSRKSSGGGSSNRSRSRRKAAARRRKVLNLMLLGSIGLLLFFGRMELRIPGPVDVLPLHNADVRAEIDGTIAKIFVDEGDQVEKGDRIAKLSGRSLRSDLKKTMADIDKARAELQGLLAGPTKEEIEVARQEVKAAQDQVRFARSKRERSETLFNRNVISKKDYDATLEDETSAVNDLAEARGKLKVLLQGSRPEEVQAARANLARLKAERDYLEYQIGNLEVLSPAAGVITTPSRELKSLLRTSVSKGDLIAKVHELDVITVEASISEKEIADVTLGQAIGIKVRAYPNRVFYGKVTEIATTTESANKSNSSSSSSSSSGSGSSSSKSPTSIRVTTEIDNGDGLLKPGMTGMAKIYGGERRIIDLVIRRLARTFRVEFWSWW